MLELRDVVRVSASTRARRRRPKLNRAETDKALDFIAECCAKQRHPVKFLCGAIGCSHKTAGRILSSRRPYSALMKRTYAARFARSMGYPLESVTDPVDLDYEESLRGWMSIGPATLATKSAATLGAGIATRSMRVFGMLADFTVAHGLDGRPATVSVVVSPDGDQTSRHTLVIAESSLTSGLLLTHLDASRARRGQVAPSEAVIDRILKSIKNEQKNITTKRVG